MHTLRIQIILISTLCFLMGCSETPSENQTSAPSAQTSAIQSESPVVSEVSSTPEPEGIIPSATTPPIPELHGTPQPPNPSRPANLAEGLIAHYAFEGNDHSFDNQYNNYWEDMEFYFDQGVTGLGGVYIMGLNADPYIYVHPDKKIGRHFEKGFTFSTWVQINSRSDIENVARSLIQGDSFDLKQFAFYWTPGGADLILNKDSENEFWPKRLLKPRAEVQNHDWQHWVVSYDYKEVKIYFNGKLDFQADYEQALPELEKIGLSIGHTPMYILSNEERKTLPYINGMRGMMDEVRIYDRALAPEEVTQLYEYK